jgi:hypothetical protein
MTIDQEGFELSSTFRWLTGMLRVFGGIQPSRFAWAEISEIYRVNSDHLPAFSPPGLLFVTKERPISWWSRSEAAALEVLEAVEAFAPPGKLRDRTVRPR